MLSLSLKPLASERGNTVFGNVETAPAEWLINDLFEKWIAREHAQAWSRPAGIHGGQLRKQERRYHKDSQRIHPPDYSCAICANLCRLCTNPALGRPKKRTHSRRRRAFADESQQLCSGRDFWPGHGESCRAAGVTACRRASTVPATSVETGGSCRSGDRLRKTFSDKKRICADCAQPAPRGHLKKRTHFYRMRASGTAGPPTFRMTHGNAESG